MIVAIIPIWSPVTRSIPISDNATPRQKLPPPTTIATCTPSSLTSRTSFAIRLKTLGEIANSPSPISASPLILSKIRRYAGAPFDIYSLPFNVAFTSSARSVVCFSMPSPTSKRKNAVTVAFAAFNKSIMV